MGHYDKIFDLLVELSDKFDADGMTVTSQRIELALDALLAEAERRPVPPAVPVPVARVVPRRAGARRRALDAG